MKELAVLKKSQSIYVKRNLMETHEDGSSIEVGPGDAYTFAQVMMLGLLGKNNL